MYSILCNKQCLSLFLCKFTQKMLLMMELWNVGPVVLSYHHWLWVLVLISNGLLLGFMVCYSIFMLLLMCDVTERGNLIQRKSFYLLIKDYEIQQLICKMQMQRLSIQNKTSYVYQVNSANFDFMLTLFSYWETFWTLKCRDFVLIICSYEYNISARR